MGSNIFSTYSTGENRVTASVLAVLKSLSIERMERLLGALLEQSEFQLISFENQPSKGAAGVPDAMILSSCRLLIETKIIRNSIRKEQIQRHLDRLDLAKENTQALLIITPDDHIPSILSTFNDKRLIWTSFASLDQAIEELLNDKAEVISEREAFLLRELQAMLLEEGLVGSSKEVVVVPAKDAWDEYQQYHAYVCQANRPFQPVDRMAFYTAGQIYPKIPKILDRSQENLSVRFERNLHKGWLGTLVNNMLKAGLRKEGVSYRVIKLSPPEESETITLPYPIINNLKSESGRTAAFTQNQRYVALDSLKKAKYTSELLSSAS